MQAKIKTAPEGADGDLSPCVSTKLRQAGRGPGEDMIYYAESCETYSAPV